MTAPPAVSAPGAAPESPPIGDRTPVRAASRRRRAKRALRGSWQLYVLVAPAVLFFLIFHYVPMYGAQIAFRDFIASDGIWGSSWVGFEHFERFFDSYYFWRLLRNTLVLSLYQLLLFPLPIILALALNEVKNHVFKRFAQTLTYAPHFVSLVVVVGMLFAFMDPLALPAGELLEQPPLELIGAGGGERLGHGPLVLLAPLREQPLMGEAAAGHQLAHGDAVGGDRGSAGAGRSGGRAPSRAGSGGPGRPARTPPLRGVSSRDMPRSRVDFPLPLAPTMIVIRSSGSAEAEVVDDLPAVVRQVQVLGFDQCHRG